MPKRLSERIAQRIRTQKPSQAGQNRASFLAVRDDVRQALNDGWSVKVIWNTLHEEGKIAFGYDAFIGYVNRLIRHSRMSPVNVPPDVTTQNKAPSSQSQKNQPNPAASSMKPPAIGGFHFNPTPKKEDLF